jgi:hypothetical protein
MKEVEAPGDPLSRFISRLFDTPALRQLPALQKEEQALHFVNQNGVQLGPVFASLGLDMTRGWKEPAAQVARAVRAEAERLLGAELAVLVSSRLTLSFYPVLSGGRQVPPRARQELQALFQKTAGRPASRSALAGSLAAARSDITDKYIPLAWDHKKYLYVEVSRVQRLNLPAADLADLVRFVLMVRPAAYLHVTPGDTPERDAGFTPFQEQYLQKLAPAIASQLPSFPQNLVLLGLRSTAPGPSTPGLEAVARLAAILAFRGRTLVPGMVVDRGADTPDKSWFNVARKNARWHGLDQRMLEELYTIAAENGW